MHKNRHCDKNSMNPENIVYRIHEIKRFQIWDESNTITHGPW